MDRNSERDNYVYADTPPVAAGIKGFFASTAIWTVGFSAMSLVWERLFYKLPFRQATWLRIKENLPGNAMLAGFFGIFDGMRSYGKARSAEKQHELLATENYLLESKLNEAGQVLNSVHQGRGVASHVQASQASHQGLLGSTVLHDRKA